MNAFFANISADSVWQYYELVSTQWILPLVGNLNDSKYRAEYNIPDTGPAPQFHLTRPYESPTDPDDTVGLVVPPFLANTLIETYNQGSSSCIGCHEGAKMTNGAHADFSWVLMRAE